MQGSSLSFTGAWEGVQERLKHTADAPANFSSQLCVCRRRSDAGYPLKCSLHKEARPGSSDLNRYLSDIFLSPFNLQVSFQISSMINRLNFYSTFLAL